MKIAYVCDLLDSLEEFETRPVSLHVAEKKKEHNERIKIWFKTHHGIFEAEGTDQAVLLSILLPEQRSDRKYGMQEPRLASVLGRTLG